jgi:hypothetical protein
MDRLYIGRSSFGSKQSLEKGGKRSIAVKWLMTQIRVTEEVHDDCRSVMWGIGLFRQKAMRSEQWKIYIIIFLNIRAMKMASS